MFINIRMVAFIISVSCGVGGDAVIKQGDNCHIIIINCLQDGVDVSVGLSSRIDKDIAFRYGDDIRGGGFKAVAFTSRGNKHMDIGKVLCNLPCKVVLRKYGGDNIELVAVFSRSFGTSCKADKRHYKYK